MRAGVLVFLIILFSGQVRSGKVYDIDTYLSMGNLSGITVSPDGAFVAYTLYGRDLEKDLPTSTVWMVPTGGGDSIRMTSSGGSSHTPKWSPDNRFLAILSERQDHKTQVWLLDRRGGDAQQLTEFKQGVNDYNWSPDGDLILLQVTDATPSAFDEEMRPNPRPYVIDRLQFKKDYIGYLDRHRNHLHVVDLETRQTRQLTFGDFDDSHPVWSPDGKHIAFVSNRTQHPDRNRNTEIWRLDLSKQSGELEQLTSNPYEDAYPTWSPDGRYLAYTTAASEGLPIYAISQLAILDLESGEERMVESLSEVQIYNPKFSRDGKRIFALAEHRGEQQLISVNVETGFVRRILHHRDVVKEFEEASSGQLYALVARPKYPAEIFTTSENGDWHQLSTVHSLPLNGIAMGSVEKHEFESEPGTKIQSFYVFPPDYREDEKYPAILHIHGGPQSQWDFGFNYESQLLAAQGYIVVMPNPRGSFGYGQAFAGAIRGRWGDPDFIDVMAAMDFGIHQDWIDPNRIAVYGWSYGGMLTNHVITKTNRFDAAITGASATLYAANYGHDQYQLWWEEELGFPWLQENKEAWESISPFYSLDKVGTPTLVVGGEKDWNVPILNSEQLYIVLKRRGIPTRLVVYPGEHHSLSVPSYEKHLYDQYFEWLETYVTSEF